MKHDRVNAACTQRRGDTVAQLLADSVINSPAAVNRKVSANPTNSQTSQQPKWLDQLRGKTRLLHFSKRTEDANVDWATKFIVFHARRPQEVASGLSQGVVRCPNQESTGKKHRPPHACWKYSSYPPPVRGIISSILGTGWGAPILNGSRRLSIQHEDEPVMIADTARHERIRGGSGNSVPHRLRPVRVRHRRHPSRSLRHPRF